VPLDAYPASLPPFVLDGHAREAAPVIDRGQMEVGPARGYRIFTKAPQFADCSTPPLFQVQYDALHDFYQAKKSGELSFYVRVSGPTYSTGVEWWEARFVGGFHAKPANGYRYVVSMRLMLLDGPFLSMPT